MKNRYYSGPWLKPYALSLGHVHRTIADMKVNGIGYCRSVTLEKLPCDNAAFRVSEYVDGYGPHLAVYDNVFHDIRRARAAYRMLLHGKPPQRFEPFAEVNRSVYK